MPRCRNALQSLPNDYDSFWINRQVIREYLKVMSLEMKNAGKVDYVALRREIVDYLRIVQVAETSDATTAHLITLIEATFTSGKQVYDTNIVTTMLANGVDFLLTHNVADFKRFGNLITVVPLVVP